VPRFGWLLPHGYYTRTRLLPLRTGLVHRLSLRLFSHWFGLRSVLGGSLRCCHHSLSRISFVLRACWFAPQLLPHYDFFLHHCSCRLGCGLVTLPVATLAVYYLLPPLPHYAVPFVTALRDCTLPRLHCAACGLHARFTTLPALLHGYRTFARTRSTHVLPTTVFEPPRARRRALHRRA